MAGIERRFSEIRKALVTFVTAGDPHISELPAILRTLEEGGADILEVGIPFSDPIADGPTIQASSQRALDRGIRLADVFSAIRESAVSVPVVLMGYTNTAMSVGYHEFAARAAEAGVAGVILSDMPPDEAGDWKAAAARHGLDTIFLAAPTSTDERIRLACEASSGFVYCVSRTGVTGTGSAMPGDVADTVSRVRAQTSLPVCVGFGISNPEHVRAVWQVADGAVVGSYLVDLLTTTWDAGRGRETLLRAIRELRGA